MRLLALLAFACSALCTVASPRIATPSAQGASGTFAEPIGDLAITAPNRAMTPGLQNAGFILPPLPLAMIGDRPADGLTT